MLGRVVKQDAIAGLAACAPFHNALESHYILEAALGADHPRTIKVADALADLSQGPGDGP